MKKYTLPAFAIFCASTACASQPIKYLPTEDGILANRLIMESLLVAGLLEKDLTGGEVQTSDEYPLGCDFFNKGECTFLYEVKTPFENRRRMEGFAKIDPNKKYYQVSPKPEIHSDAIYYYDICTVRGLDSRESVLTPEGALTQEFEHRIRSCVDEAGYVNYLGDLDHPTDFQKAALEELYKKWAPDSEEWFIMQKLEEEES